MTIKNSRGARRAAALALLAVATLTGCGSSDEPTGTAPTDTGATGPAPVDANPLVPATSDGAAPQTPRPLDEPTDTAPLAHCLVAVSTRTDHRFRYCEDDRELASLNADDTLRWSFSLPGDPRSNLPRNLAVADERLVLVAELQPDSGPIRAFELSTFDFSGAFGWTVPIDVLAAVGTSIGDADGPLDVLGDDDALIVTAAYRATDDEPQHGTLIARVAIDSGAVVVSRIVQGVSPSAPSRLSADGLVLELDQVPVLLDARTLQAPSIDGAAPGYDPDARGATRDELLGLFASPPVDALAGRLDAIDSIDIDSERFPEAPFRCSDGGGYVRYDSSSIWDGFVRHYTNCATGPLQLDGEMHRGSSEFFDKYSRGERQRLRFGALVVSDADSGTTWALTLTRQRGRITASGPYPGPNQPVEPQSVDLPRESTIIAAFDRRDERSELTISDASYTYRGNRASGYLDAAWSGRATRTNIATGTVEIIEADLQRIVSARGVETIAGSLFASATGAGEASFRVEASPDDVALLRYTIIDDEVEIIIDEPW